MKASWLLVAAALLVSGCSSGPAIKSQAYAKLPNHRVFEYEFPVVWKAIEASLRNNKIVDRDPEEVDALEMKKLERRTLETDWAYSQSRDKYVEFQVNGSPRKTYLQTRIKYEIEAKKVMGGTEVTVKTDEEVERLKANGTPNGYGSVGEPDPSRASDLLDKIQNAIISAPNI